MEHPLDARVVQRASHRGTWLAGIVALALMVLAMLAAPKPAHAAFNLSFPTAVIDATPTYLQANGTVAFSGARSYGIELSVPQQWDWKFGDGATASGVTVSHVYTTPGQYTATLTVTDQWGHTDDEIVPITVWDYPTAAVTTSATTGLAPLTVSFDGSASTSAGWALNSYVWDFGDGTSATGVTATHTYTTPGWYTASLSVKNVLGWGSTAYAQIYATQPMAPPTNLAATSPTRGNVTLKWTNRMTALFTTEIQRCSGSRCTAFVTVNYVPVTYTTYSEGGLKSGSSFRYRLKIKDIAGAVGYSNIASVKVR